MTTSDISVSIAEKLNTISREEPQKLLRSNAIHNPFAKVVDNLSDTAIRDMHTAVVNKLAKVPGLVDELFNTDKLFQILNKRAFKNFVGYHSQYIPNSVVVNTIMCLFDAQDYQKHTDFVLESVYKNLFKVEGILEPVYDNIFANEANGRLKMREFYNGLMDIAVRNDDASVFHFLVESEQYDYTPEQDFVVYKFTSLDLEKVLRQVDDESEIADYIRETNLEQRFKD
jgi:hypothetical protein